MYEGDSYVRGEIMKTFELWIYFNILKGKFITFYHRTGGDILSIFTFNKNLSFNYLQNNIKVSVFYSVFHNTIALLNDMKHTTQV